MMNREIVSVFLVALAWLPLLCSSSSSSSAEIGCRSDPTWRGTEAACARETAWTPRSALWEGKLDRFEHLVLSECVDDQRHPRQGATSTTTSSSRQWQQLGWSALHQKLRGKRAAFDHVQERQAKEETRVAGVYPNFERPLAVELEFALSESEAAAISATATCVRKYHNDTHFADRRFEEGGNYCTYMAGYLQVLAPGVSARIVSLARMARSAAGWGDEHSDPGTLGVRTNEHLRYSAGGMVGKHTDDESVYTIVVALSDPADYDGGEYVLYDDQVPDPTREHRVKLRRLSALVFLSSLTLHGVSPITRGSREVFAAELWEEDDVPTDWMRPNVRDFREGVLGQAVEL